jgi:hypothetical protein
MRTKDGPYLAPALIAAAMMLAMTCAGCTSMNTEREWGACAGIGALVGGLGGAGSGLAIADNTHGSHREQAPEAYAYGYSFGGAAVGAIIGAVVGHEICDPEVQPRSVTYYRSNASSTSSTSSTYSNP